MKVVTLKSGETAVLVPGYSDAFRAAMRSVAGAHFTRVQVGGQSHAAYAFPLDQREHVVSAYREHFPPEPTLAEPITPLEAVVIDAVGVVGRDGATYAVVGGAFHAMKESVKEIDSSRWDGDAMVWRCVRWSREEIAAAVAADGFRLIPAADLIDEEIQQIAQAQQTILAARAQIEERIELLDRQIAGYSFRSKSRIRANHAQDRTRMAHALDDAAQSVEDLTKPQIQTLLKVVREDLS